MKPVALILLVTLLGAAGAPEAAPRGNCPERGRCATAPTPPAPPQPPQVPDVPDVPDVPNAPMPPMPPMPPAPPALPAVPDAAHDACAGKAIGSKMTYQVRRGETMRGSCEKDDKGMYFELHEYRRVK
jgi:hypothetical protein